MRVFERSLATIENNVANVSTPGYVRQRQALIAAPFLPEGGLYGGVLAGSRESARDDFAERMVRERTTASGYEDQVLEGLNRIEPAFDPTGEAGIPGALDKLFQSFSALTVTPNDTVARNVVIDRARVVVSAFRNTISTVDTAEADIRTQVTTRVDSVNRVAKLLSEYNTQASNSGGRGADPALEAAIYNGLEELSGQLDIRTLKQTDGTFTVTTSGGFPLVIGSQQFDLTVDASGQTVQILDPAGNQLTGQITGGSLGGLLALANTVLPGVKTDMNALAQTLADRVNGILMNGLDANGLSGMPLFQYDGVLGAAGSLALTSVTAPEIAAADLASPGGNGNALTLASLSDSIELGGLTFAGSYGNIASGVGRRIASAKENQGVQSELMTQAKILRQDQSGVSLDEEAVKMLEYQRAYQASAQMITVLNALTQTLIDMVR